LILGPQSVDHAPLERCPHGFARWSWVTARGLAFVAAIMELVSRRMPADGRTAGLLDQVCAVVFPLALVLVSPNVISAIGTALSDSDLYGKRVTVATSDRTELPVKGFFSLGLSTESKKWAAGSAKAPPVMNTTLCSWPG
jgi:hypothetical protein